MLYVMDISIPQAWKEMKNAFKKMQKLLFTYNVLDERVLRRHKIMMTGLFLFWVVFVIGRQFWSIWFPQLSFNGRMFSGYPLITLWFSVAVVLCEQFFLNILLITTFGNVKRQLYNFGLAKKYYKEFCAGRDIFCTTLYEDGQDHSEISNETRCRRMAFCLARYIRLLIFVDKFKQKFPGFRKKDMEANFDTYILDQDLIRWAGGRMHNELYSACLFVNNGSHRFNSRISLAEEPHESIRLIDSILSGGYNSDIYNDIDDLEEVIYDILSNYRYHII
jgi:hypothetical protein